MSEPLLERLHTATQRWIREREFQAADVKAIIEAINLLKHAQLGFQDTETHAVCAVPHHTFEPPEGYRNVLILPAKGIKQ